MKNTGQVERCCPVSDCSPKTIPPVHNHNSTLLPRIFNDIWVSQTDEVEVMCSCQAMPIQTAPERKTIYLEILNPFPMLRYLNPSLVTLCGEQQGKRCKILVKIIFWSFVSVERLLKRCDSESNKAKASNKTSEKWRSCSTNCLCSSSPWLLIHLNESNLH